MEMTYRLLVEQPKHFSLDFWENFMEKSGFLGQKMYNIDHYLKPWHAKNIKNEPYIEFESEEDATLFLLRWS
jgi:hypothetical protein